MKNITILLFSLISVSSLGQDFTEGFKLLNEQNYTEAHDYFSKRVDSFPENITANICYGRALGLKGESADALAFFGTLRLKYPYEEEVRMNLAEALMWNKQYSKALEEYKILYKNHPDKIYLRTKYAENLSQVKQHDEALSHIDTVVHFLADSTALLSHKYLYLAAAYEYSQQNNSKKALSLLDHALESHPNDGDIILLQGDIALKNKKSQSARNLYTLDAAKKADKYRSARGEILALYQSENYTRATDKLLSLLSTNPKSQDSILATDLYLAQNMLTEARVFYNPDNASHTISAIKLLQYTAQASATDTLIPKLESESLQLLKSHEIHLFANRNKKSDSLLDVYNQIYGENGPYNYRLATQTQKTSDYVQLGYIYGMDSDSGRSDLATLEARFRITPKSYLLPMMSIKRTQALKGDSSARANFVGLGYTYLPSEYFNIEASAGITEYTKGTELIPIYNLALTYKPRPNHYLRASLNKQFQDFNTPLLDQGLTTHNIAIAYNYMWRQRFGFYTQASYQLWSDANGQFSFYNSLYCKISRKPGIKTGINVQYMSFSDNKPLLYFSPEKFLLTEAFIELHRDVAENAKFFYHLFGSYGFQNIDNEARQSTYRAEAQLGYKIIGESYLSIFGGRSNAANTTVSGFAYTTVGLKSRIYF